MKFPHIFPTAAAAALLLAATAACTRDLDVYEGESGIYFDTSYDNAVLPDDTISVPWGLKNSSVTRQKVILNVVLFGETAPVDRSFSITLGSEPGDDMAAEPGIDYIEPAADYVIPAGKAVAPVEIEVLRRPTLMEKPRRVTVRLVPTDDLRFLYSRERTTVGEDGTETTRSIDFQRVIYLDESFPQPIWWSYRGQPYFGDWSATKSALICDVMNIDREDWVASNELSAGYLKFCGRYMYRWLLENPQTDEDGGPMTMGPQSTI